MGPGRKELTELAALDVGDLLEHEPLSRHGTWQIGGPADLLVQLRNSPGCGATLMSGAWRPWSSARDPTCCLTMPAFVGW